MRVRGDPDPRARASMPTMKLLYPSGVPIDLSAPDGVQTVVYDPRAPWPAEHMDADFLVVWGNPQARLEEAARGLGRLRWVQSLAAGPDAVVRAGFAPGVAITSGRGLHDGPVAEHTLALTLAALRRLHLMRDAQAQRRWPGELGGGEQASHPGPITLSGARVLVWGFGSIALRLAPLLTALGAQVQGVARSSGERGGYPVLAESQLAEALPQTDVLIMVLPSLSGTQGALNAERLALLPPHAWLVNVGRGATVDEAALVSALQEGRLAGAALDVFATEPLPADSPLWSLPNVLVSPHAAGGRPQEAGRLIAENLRRLLAGETLRNLVER